MSDEERDITNTDTNDPGIEQTADGSYAAEKAVEEPTESVSAESGTADKATEEPTESVSAESGTADKATEEPTESVSAENISAEKAAEGAPERNPVPEPVLSGFVQTPPRTFSERMGEAGYVAGRRYDAVKNAFLSYRPVDARKTRLLKIRMTRSGETFTSGRKPLAKLCLVGGYLRLFLSLDPKAYSVDKYHHKDYSDVLRYESYPMMIKLTSDRQVRNAVSLIDDLMTSNGYEPNPYYVSVDRAGVFNTKTVKRPRVVYIETDFGKGADKAPEKEIAAGAVTEEADAADKKAEEELEPDLIDVRLPGRATVLDKQGEKIGKVRHGVWYDLAGDSHGEFRKEDVNVFFYKEKKRAGYLDANNNVLTMGDEFMAKLQKFRWPVLIIVVVLLALITALSVFLSLYFMSVSGDDYAPVLFIAHEEGTEWSDSENLPVFYNELFGDSKIMPGMKGAYRFTFANNNPNSLDYSLDFTEDNESGIDLRYRLKRDGAYISGAEDYVSVGDLDAEGLTIEAHSRALFELEWYWEHNDEIDTEAGMGGATYTLTINFTATVGR